MREIDQIPASESPVSAFASFMFKPRYEMHRVIQHLVGRRFRLEGESAKTALASALGVELWIEVENALRFLVDHPQVRVTGALHAVFGGAREIASQSRCRIEQIAQQILEMTADLVDARDLLDCAPWFIQTPNDFVEHS